MTKHAPGNGLLGLFGHTLNEDGEVIWQFQVVRRASNDAYIVQLYSWLDGSPTQVTVLGHDDLLSERCRLYLSAKQMHEAYDQYSRRMRP
jgi:hypothetical protein